MVPRRKKSGNRENRNNITLEILDIAVLLDGLDEYEEIVWADWKSKTLKNYNAIPSYCSILKITTKTQFCIPFRVNKYEGFLSENVENA